MAQNDNKDGRDRAGRSRPVRLPAYVRSLFWDMDAGRLRWSRHRDCIILRILSRGGFDAVRWLRQTVGDAQLREWIVARSGRGIDSRRLVYYGVILDLPHDLVLQWTERCKQYPWELYG